MGEARGGLAERLDVEALGDQFPDVEDPRRRKLANHAGGVPGCRHSSGATPLGTTALAPVG